MSGGARWFNAVLLVLASSALSGCFLWTSAGDGDTLRERADESDVRISALEKRLAAEREAITEELTTKLATKSSELEDLLDRATKVVQRNSADVTVEVQQLRERLDALDGQIAELRNLNDSSRREIAAQRTEIEARITELRVKTGLESGLLPSDIPSNPRDLFAAAYRAYQRNVHEKARALFRVFIDRYREDADSDNAMYWRGMSFLAQDQAAAALGEFRAIFERYQQNPADAALDSIDEALFGMADAFYRMQECRDARTSLEALGRMQQAPAKLRDDARTKLRDIQRAPRGYCRN